MCGILGMAFLEGHKIKNHYIPKTILRKLLLESKVRGTDATGVAFASNTNVAVIKHNIHAGKFISSRFYEQAEKRCIVDENKSFGPLNVIIGHTRAQTKGTHRDRDNNHPVVANGVIGVHNGNISNDDTLFESYIGNHPSTFKRRAWVDTEIIFRLIDHYKHTIKMETHEAVTATDKCINGSYACAFVAASEPWMLWLFKDWSPTTIFHYPDVGLVVFASAENFIKRAVAGLTLGDPVEIEYDRESCMAINTAENTFTSFELSKKSWEGNQGL